MIIAFSFLTLAALFLVAGYKGQSIGEIIRGDPEKGGDGLLGKITASVSEADALEFGGGSKSGGSAGGVVGGLQDFGAKIQTKDGARATVERAAKLAAHVGGSGVYVGSAFRPGSITSSGNLSDHAGNDAARAARDIGVHGLDLLTGPPSPKLDKAVVAIGQAFGRDYRPGERIVDTFTHGDLQIQIIWRTPEYGGHMGHIHIGAHKV